LYESVLCPQDVLVERQVDLQPYADRQRRAHHVTGFHVRDLPIALAMMLR
jgi:hypothetical protein